MLLLLGFALSVWFFFRLKLLEIKAGVDGFMVYDMNLIEPMQKVNSNITNLTQRCSWELSESLTHHSYSTNIFSVVRSQLFQLHCTGPNQLQELRNDIRVTPEDLLTVPAVSHFHTPHQRPLPDHYRMTKNT